MEIACNGFVCNGLYANQKVIGTVKTFSFIELGFRNADTLGGKPVS